MKAIYELSNILMVLDQKERLEQFREWEKKHVATLSGEQLMTRQLLSAVKDPEVVERLCADRLIHEMASKVAHEVRTVRSEMGGIVRFSAEVMVIKP